MQKGKESGYHTRRPGEADDARTRRVFAASQQVWAPSKEPPREPPWEAPLSHDSAISEQT